MDPGKFNALQHSATAREHLQERPIFHGKTHDFPFNRPISTRSRHVEEVHRLRTAAGLPQDDRRGLGEACVLLLRRLDDESGHPFRWLAV